MQEYDIAFKLTLQQVDLTIRELTGTAVAKWLNVELPEVQGTRADLLGETAAGDLIHIELQSSNDATMPLRMAEYCLRVLRQFRRFPEQLVVYVGEPPMRMSTELRGPRLQYSYRLVDIRELNGELLLSSPQVGDNIVAILTRLADVRGSVDRILAGIARLEPGERERALARLLILSELRKLVEEEARKMPILNDILDHSVLGREYKKGELAVLRRQIEKRFGSIPAWAEERLAGMPPRQLEELGVRFLDAQSLEELLPPTPPSVTETEPQK